MLVGSGWVSPSEFWGLHPHEVPMIIDAKVPNIDEIMEQHSQQPTLDQMYQALIDDERENGN